MTDPEIVPERVDCTADRTNNPYASASLSEPLAVTFTTGNPSDCELVLDMTTSKSPINSLRLSDRSPVNPSGQIFGIIDFDGVIDGVIDGVLVKLRVMEVLAVPVGVAVGVMVDSGVNDGVIEPVTLLDPVTDGEKDVDIEFVGVTVADDVPEGDTEDEGVPDPDDDAVEVTDGVMVGLTVELSEKLIDLDGLRDGVGDVVDDGEAVLEGEGLRVAVGVTVGVFEGVRDLVSDLVIDVVLDGVSDDEKLLDGVVDGDGVGDAEQTAS